MWYSGCVAGKLEKSKYLELTLYISFGVGTDSSFATICNKNESVSLYSGCTVPHTKNFWKK